MSGAKEPRKVKRKKLSVAVSGSAPDTGDAPTPELMPSPAATPAEAPPRAKKLKKTSKSGSAAVDKAPEKLGMTSKVAKAPENKIAEAVDNRGVIHLATIPMCMTAEKVRHLMEEFGEIGRVYLAPEDKVIHNRRKKTGGNRKARFVEGWVEFADKRVAKRIALALHGHQIGGRKRFFREDTWNMKYLSKFKWYQLKEGSIYNHQVRKARLEQKVSQARRENDFFMEKLHQAKTQKKIDEKRASKAGRDGTAGDKRALGAGGESRFPAAKRRIGDRDSGAGMAPKIPDISDRVLGSLL